MCPNPPRSILPPLLPPWKTLSSVKLVPGARKVGDHCRAAHCMEWINTFNPCINNSSICYQLSEIWENRDSHQFQKSLVLTRSTWLVIVRSLVPTFWAFPGGASGKCRFTTKPRHLPVQVRCKTRQFHPWVEKIPWRRKWQLTPAFLPGESHGQRSLKGYRPWSRTESNITEVT